MDDHLCFKYRLFDVINDIGTYKDFHNLLFQGSATSYEWIIWYHKNISNLKKWSRGTRTYAVFDANKLVGVWSVEPKVLKVDQGEIKVGRCFAVGIHPDYRRHGLFVSLSKFAIQQEKELGEYEYIIGFPQKGRTVIGGHFKAGWEQVQDIEIYSCKITPKLTGLSLYHANLIRDFNEVALLQQTYNGLIETAAYKNLRWLKHPDHQYLAYSNKNAYIIL